MDAITPFPYAAALIFAIATIVQSVRLRRAAPSLRKSEELAMVAMAERMDAIDEANSARKSLDHYQKVFLPSMVAERDRWHDLYMDAVVTYGNAQDRYERAIEHLSKRAKVPFPAEVRAVMDANKAKAEKGKATPKLVIKEGDRPELTHEKLA